jgi:hypothetical protein
MRGIIEGITVELDGMNVAGDYEFGDESRN